MFPPMSPHNTNNQPWWQKANKILSTRRLSYAIITGGTLWIAWLLSVVLGKGNFDLANQVVGTDYIQFYSAGMIIRQGNADLLYNFDYQSEIENQIAGPELINFHAFITPPFLALLFIPFSKLPYLWSYLTFSVVNLLALFCSIKLLREEKPLRTFLWTLCWFPIFATISFGQNSLISLLILSLAYVLWRRNQILFAGIIASFILFKPQLIVGVATLWLIRWRKDWKALLGLLLGSFSIGGVMLIYMPAALKDYLQLTLNFLPNMIYNDQFPLYHLHTLRGFLILLLPGMDTLIDGLVILMTLIAIIFFIRFVIKEYDHLSICFSAAIALTIFITPHAMIYDWALLLIPAILFWQERPDLQKYWKVIYAILWLVTLISGPLTYLQNQYLSFALQISVPILLLILIDIHKVIKGSVSQSEVLS